VPLELRFEVLVKWIMYGARSHYHIGAFDGKTFKPET